MPKAPIKDGEPTLLYDSPLFDVDYYRTHNTDIPPEVDPVAHFCASGWR
ncbi:MAG TPA: hypothetical protein PK677_07835 [Acidiphilium sp.]|nr:hypothetical protein [Acidiphilium sp.]HQU23278.1 hypothetical protein [Acidiphilium sp.]